MIGFIKLVSVQPAETGLSSSCRLKIEGSLWTGVIVIIWVALIPFWPQLGFEVTPFAEWVALGLAGLASFTALQVKRRLWRKLDKENELKIKPPNPLGLIDVLRDHGVREFGSMYLYMPIPRRPKHNHAWAWLEMLEIKGLIKGEPWNVNAKHVSNAIRESHPNLFEGSPTQFDIYRLDWRTLTQMMDDLD